MIWGAGEMQTENAIHLRDGKVSSYIGPDAVEVFRAKAIKAGITMWAKTGMRPNRHWTPTAMIQAAGRITGKTYRVNKKSAELIAADLEIWINNMISALPIVEDNCAN